MTPTTTTSETWQALPRMRIVAVDYCGDKPAAALAQVITLLISEDALTEKEQEPTERTE